MERNRTFAGGRRWPTMLNEDCLNVRLSDFLNRRRDPLSDAAAEAADNEDEAQQDYAEDGDG